MTDNQFNQLFGLVTKCVNGIQKLETDVAELKGDVAELKQGQAELKEGQVELKEGQDRLEKEIKITNKALSILTEDSLRTRARVELLEQQKELSN